MYTLIFNISWPRHVLYHVYDILFNIAAVFSFATDLGRKSSCFVNEMPMHLHLGIS